MARSGTIKTLAALVGALTVGAGVLIWMETDPAQPPVPLSLEAVQAGGGDAAPSAVRDTDVPLQYIKWSNIVLHDSGRDGEGVRQGCHFLIGGGKGDAVIVSTRLWRQQRAGEHVHVPGYSYNENSIGICLLSDCRRAGPGARQFGSLLKLVRSLQVTFQIPRDHVYLHADLGAAGCPGGQFPAERFRQGLLRSAR